MENQIEKKMESQVETEIIWGDYRGSRYDPKGPST